VPPLPELSDPELFIRFHDAAVHPLPLHDGTLKNYSRFRKFIKPRFASLAKRGDAFLSVICQEIVYEFFGEENSNLVNIIFEAATSNDSWRDLAIAYKLHVYVGMPPRSQRTDKFWADMWEAYWGALFIERKLWNDDDEDLISCLRVLLYLQLEGLIEDYGVKPLFTSEPIRTANTDFELPSPDEIEVTEITDCPGVKVNPQIKGAKVLGYCVNYKSTSDKVTYFSQIKEDAISNLVVYCCSPWSKPSPSYPGPPRSPGEAPFLPFGLLISLFLETTNS